MTAIATAARRIWKSRNLKTEGNAAYQNAIDLLAAEIKASPVMTEEAIVNAARHAIGAFRGTTRYTGEFPDGGKVVVPQTSSVCTIPPGLSAVKNGKAMRTAYQSASNILDFPVQYTNKSLENTSFKELKYVIKRFSECEKTYNTNRRWFTAILNKGMRKGASLSDLIGTALTKTEIEKVSRPYRSFINRQFRNMP